MFLGVKIIYKTKYGHPIETESVIENITLSDLPPSYIVESKNLSFTISLSDDDLVYEQNSSGRVVYIPERMKLIRFTNNSVNQEKEYTKGHYYIDMKLGDIVIFLRENKSFVIGDGGEYVSDDLYNNLQKYSFGDNPSKYKLYNDDGFTTTYSINNITEI